MKIDRLRVAGFKSFADPVEIGIGPGVTGIVGPNGCGKSNLIEALRWAMGEASAKRMRADGMDDVIFGGTDLRPPRASCEVTVYLDNSSRLAPAAFNAEDRLEVSRRIDRGEGSSYRVNGKAARARDVQVLFKDAGIGAGSSALVSQGKVGAIINAKPSERRSVLEEAAGVTGLASRRHEAELRLRATEQNLERAEDLERGLSEQMSSLRRQARQARRRSEIDGLIRAAEAAAFLARWRAASERESSTAAAFAANEEAVKEKMIALRQAEARLAEAEAAAAPAVRARMEAETALALARARVETVRKEAAAACEALAAARKAADRARADIERETAAIGDSGEEYEELKDRKMVAEDDREYDAVLIEEATAAAQEAREALDSAAARAAEASERLAAARAERAAAERRVEDAAARLGSTRSRFEAVRARLSECRERLAALPSGDEGLREAEERLAEAEEAEAAAAGETMRSTDAEAAAREADGRIRAELSAVEAEVRALSSGRGKEGGGPAAGEAVRAQDGFEASVAAAFGDGLGALLEEGDRWWAGSGLRPGHPEGTEPLSGRVEVPKALEAALSGVGVAEDEARAEAAARRLSPGQAVVTKDGRLWRWDGYRSSGNAVAAEEMRRAARLRHLDAERERLGEAARESSRALEEAAARSAAARAAAAEARERVEAARRDLAALRSRLEGAVRERADLEARAASAAEAEAALKSEEEADSALLAAAEQALAALPDLSRSEEELAGLRKEAAEFDAAYEKARAALDKARRDAEARHLVIENIVRQMQDFDRRIVAARERVEELRGRLAEAEAEAGRLAAVVAEGPAAEAEAAEALEEALAACGEAAYAASESEQALLAARGAARSADAELSAYREERARLLAEVRAAKETASELAREIAERLSCRPDELAAISGIAADAEPPDLAACEARVQRLTRERDTIGVVNHLAEEQLAEVEAKLGEAGKSRAELREAVRRLRAAIAEFDHEARARLTEAFALIDGHFRDLFTRLFGGGHAYLRLSGSEDVLEAGLEIYACPPGKKLQAMSLLSGGEQALAALALVFAAFLVRPAPVCVLDEVDAPLDDANVDRLCSLVEDMARESTRFLVVTHHALTMARCDRLYGVTMAERGVSRVASLDLGEAAALVEERDD